MAPFWSVVEFTFEGTYAPLPFAFSLWETGVVASVEGSYILVTHCPPEASKISLGVDCLGVQFQFRFCLLFLSRYN